MKMSRLGLSLRIVGLAATAALAWLTVRADVEEAALAAADESARATALAIEAELDRIERQVAWLLRPQGDTTSAADTAFILDTTPAVSGLRLVDGQGRTIYVATRAGFRARIRRTPRTRAPFWRRTRTGPGCRRYDAPAIIPMPIWR